MEPGSGIELLFLDESEIHLYPHLVRMWMPKGQYVEVPALGKNQKIPIYGALNYRTNKVSYQVGYGKNAAEFLGFLAQLAYEYHDKHCVVVLDNASYHTACVVQKFLDELSCRFQVIWLPPYSPELNDIEHIWKYVKGASLANFDFGDSNSLRQAITKVFDELNSNPESDLTLRFRDPLSKNLLKVA
jgi:transposase